MRRLARNAAVLSVLATLAVSGTAAAFTPVPIPKPQASSVAVLARVAGASSVSGPTQSVGIIPFTGDVHTVDQRGDLIPVSITSTALSAPLYNLAGDPLNLT